METTQATDAVERMKRTCIALRALRGDVLRRGVDEAEERAVSRTIALLEGDLVDDARLVLHARDERSTADRREVAA